MPSQSESPCWWFGCIEAAIATVTENGVTRTYCPEHARRVERYYAAAARWEEKHGARP